MTSAIPEIEIHALGPQDRNILSMPKPRSDVTAGELAILEQLWEVGSSSIKDLATNLYGASTPSDVATVQKLLSRLESKNCVQRNREAWPHEFRAVVHRQDLITRRLQATADELCDGTLSGLLTHLVQSTKFNSKQRKKLRKMLDEMEDV